MRLRDVLAAVARAAKRRKAQDCAHCARLFTLYPLAGQWAKDRAQPMLRHWRPAQWGAVTLCGSRVARG